MRRTLTPAVATLLAPLLALSACGAASDEETADEAATTVAEATETSTTSAPTTTAPTTTAPTTTAPTTTAPTTTAQLADGADSEYCRIAHVADQLDSDFVDFDDPIALENYFIELNALLRQAGAVAPPEIAADLEIIKAQVVAVGASAAAFNYEFSAMMIAVEDHSNDGTDAASAAVDAYDEAVCGLAAEPDSDADGADDVSAAPTLTVEAFEAARLSEVSREQMIQGFASGRDITEEQAGCFIDEVSAELFVALASDADAADGQVVELIGLLETCGIPLSALS